MSPPFLVLLLLAQTSPSSPPPAPTGSPPAVSDPLLAPLPTAARRLTGFDQALQALQRGSERLVISGAQAAAAAARQRQALAPLLPSIQATASATLDVLHPRSPPAVAGASAVTAERGRPTVPLGVGQVTAQVPLIDVSLWKARAAARAGAEAEAASFADDQRTLLGALADSIVELLSAERAAELQRDGLRQALERQYLVNRTLELGSGTRLDLVRAQQDTRLARADVLLGRERVLQAREALGSLLGSDQPVGVEPTLNMDAFLGALDNVCRPVSIEWRPDVLASRLRLRAAEESVGEARADYLPSLLLQSSAAAYTMESGPTDVGPLRIPSWTVAAVLNIPLYDGGGRGARVDERRWTARAAQHELRLLGREAGIELIRARRAVELAGLVLAEASSARDLARDADRMTRRSFEAGASTSFELVQSAQVLRQAELGLAAREFDLAAARFAARVAEATCDIQ